MKDEILDKKIKSWEDQLLDLGKRNKMISYRESRRSTLKILTPDFEELYQKIVVEEKELTFQKAIDRDSDVRVYSILSLLDKLACPIEVNIGDIRAEGPLPEIKKTLKHLRSKARLSIDEQGTNILYLVFGFLEWRGRGSHHDSWMKSPLILVPVSLTLPSIHAQYSLKKHEDEIVVNPTLAYLFARDYGITLPEFDDDKDTLQDFMDKMESLVNDRGWRVIRECSMGLVSFSKISMYHDLIGNEDQLKRHPVLRAFAGEDNVVGRPENIGSFDHDACRSIDTFQVLNADSSQQDAIALSQKGVSFVMQGPPGTGKSQTITNMIAQGLADGKRILFVSEKMAALDVVYRRLNDVNLADFCLSLHSHKANKKDILNQLGANLELKHNKLKNEELAKLTRLDMLREQLKGYVQDVHQIIMPLEMSLYEVYGAILELGELPDVEIYIDDIENRSKEDINRLALLVANVDKARSVVGSQWQDNPWQNLTGSYMEVSRKRELKRKLTDVTCLLLMLKDCRLQDKTLADVVSVDRLDALKKIFDHARAVSMVPNEWFIRSTEQEEGQICRLRDEKQALDIVRKHLAEHYGEEFFVLSAKSLMDQLACDMKEYCKWLPEKEAENRAFDFVTDEQKRSASLRDNLQQLMNAQNEFTQAFGFQMTFDYASVRKMLTLCGMLLEQRKLTATYFVQGGIAQLSKYASELEYKIVKFVQQRQRLCSRYSEFVFKDLDVDCLLKECREAERNIENLIYGPQIDYNGLYRISEFDFQQLDRIDAALQSGMFETIYDTYGLNRPVTLDAVESQLSAIRSIESVRWVPEWKNAEARRTVKNLLQTADNKNSRIDFTKQQLQQFFEKHGFILNADTLSRTDAERFLCADEKMSVSMVQFCQDEDLGRLLDMLDKKIEQRAVLARKIYGLRKEYRTRDDLDHCTLLAQMRACQEAAFFSVPCSAWATSRTDAIALLDLAESIAQSLKLQRSTLLETFEESVFDLDYAGILNRFKVEYTGIFKKLKATYKEDVKAIRMAYREIRKTITENEIIELLQSLRKYYEDSARYYSLAPHILTLLNVQQYDIGFDWASLRKKMGLFDAVACLFENDMAAYRFISEAGWNHLYDALVSYEEIDIWFENYDEAKKVFGSLYHGAETDTEKIRMVLKTAKDRCDMFVSGEYYLAYLQLDTNDPDIHHAKELVKELGECRNWLEVQGKELAQYGGFDQCQHVFLQLDTYENIIAALGESAGCAMLERYETEPELIDSYIVSLECLMEISKYAKGIGHKAADTEEFRTVPLPRLVDELRSILSGAHHLLNVYNTLYADCPESSIKLSLGEIKADLEILLHTRNLGAELREIEAEAREKLGEEYKGLNTQWETIYSNLMFGEKVLQLLPDAASEKLIDAFISRKPLFLRVQLENLQGCMSAAEEMEKAYPEIAQTKTLNDKIKSLMDLENIIKKVVRIRETITAAAYTERRYDERMQDMQTLAKLQTMETSWNQSLEEMNQRMPGAKLNISTDWKRMAEIFDHLREIKKIVHSDTMDPELVQLLIHGIPGLHVESYADSLEKLTASGMVLKEITGFFENKSELEACSLTELSGKLERCCEQFALMDQWIDLRDARKVCEKYGLGAFLDASEKIGYVSGSLGDIFCRSFYYQWLERVCRNFESVQKFRMNTQESRIEAFCELDTLQLPISQKRIREKLIKQMPDGAESGRADNEMSVLIHELNKKRNIMPLRKLFRTIPNLLMKLKPCFMMSPLSVAHFLDASTYHFDMVIFDEASQIFPQDAIGAILRADQVIITGDSKQLPPTNFFAVSTSNEDEFDPEDGEEEEMNFDSILEEASNCLPNHSLLWHYRSRFEELIAFSNRQIYNNHLITFPSSTVYASDTGVEYVYVQNGVYENRYNCAEAQNIVRMTEEHIQKHPDRSLGIIAFSESQQTMIEEEISRFRLENPSYESFFDEEKDDPFFVKNLENVQGDERDTIFFSICYAKNEQGRMYMRFGPLGHQGGERRLNVAITRARHNIKLVGSILPEDIDLSKTNSEGVRMLRDYIAFAMQNEAASLKPEKKNRRYDEDVFSEQIGRFLMDRGYNVKMNVGSSDYTIDIAVEHPYKPGHYIAGIECDGNCYHMARTVRDREHLRTSVLEQMGWKMYRVWSTEWIRNPEKEQKRLMNFISDALMHDGVNSTDK